MWFVLAEQVRRIQSRLMRLGACALSPPECVAEFFKLFGGNRIGLHTLLPAQEQCECTSSEKSPKCGEQNNQCAMRRRLVVRLDRWFYDLNNGRVLGFIIQLLNACVAIRQLVRQHKAHRLSQFGVTAS
jgi:hypothetical protein